MAASRAGTGNGAKFNINGVAVLEVKTVKTALMSVPEVNYTHLESPNSTEEFGPGLIKPGTVTVGGNFIGDATQLNIKTLAEAQTVFPWSITSLVDRGTKTYTCSGTGYVAKYEAGPFEQNKAIEFQFELQISGAISESVA